MKTVSSDVLVIGTGIAGLSFALKASEHGSVAMVTKKRRADSSTNWAQGGVAAVFAADDAPGLHARDTFLAGAGLCHSGAVRALVREGPPRVRDLEAWGVAFTQSGGTYELGREGGHSKRRIVHAGDLTGREIERALLAALAQRRNVSLFEDHVAIDLVLGLEGATGRPRCQGATALDHVHNERVHFEAGVVMLAAGGLGQVYPHTTNPDIATGDGMAMAYRAGATLANLEFVQFHPTALYPADEHAFLISEAVRGEGALLRRLDGTLLMEGVHPLGSLAPRDVVARAIDFELKRSGGTHVLLDLTPIGRERLERRFPGILAECTTRGFDLPREALPVVPAAHYACGGVLTDAAGRTSIAGLFAAGEVACTGVHGANRLASNSLLEAVVYSHRAAAGVPLELRRASAQAVSGPSAGSAVASGRVVGEGRAAAQSHAPGQGGSAPQAGDGAGEVAALRAELRRLMWADAGIVRQTERLDAAASEVSRIRELATVRAAGQHDAAAIELRNLADTAALILACALRRRESRGLHYNVDHPYRDNERWLRDTVLVGEDR
jgi:L-aspartate oxidase